MIVRRSPTGWSAYGDDPALEVLRQADVEERARRRGELLAARAELHEYMTALAAVVAEVMAEGAARRNERLDGLAGVLRW